MKILKITLCLLYLTPNINSTGFWTNSFKGAALLFGTFAPIAATPGTYSNAGNMEYYDKIRAYEKEGKLDSQTSLTLKRKLKRDKLGAVATNLIIAGIAGRSCFKFFRK